MNISEESEDTLDLEWVNLIKIAISIGISIEEVRLFLTNDSIYTLKVPK